MKESTAAFFNQIWLGAINSTNFKARFALLSKSFLLILCWKCYYAGLLYLKSTRSGWDEMKIKRFSMRDEHKKNIKMWKRAEMPLVIWYHQHFFRSRRSLSFRFLFARVLPTEPALILVVCWQTFNETFYLNLKSSLMTADWLRIEGFFDWNFTLF